MLIPIRCFTCGSVLADKWEYYNNKLKQEKTEKKKDEITIEDLTIDEKNIVEKYFDDNISKKILDNLNITRICCRRHFLSTIDLIDTI